MDQRAGIGAGRAPERPIHRACVVPGCWCGSTTAAGSRPVEAAGERAVIVRTTPSLDAPIANLTNIAWRCVGLPVA
jgi:hypothetical protein